MKSRSMKPLLSLALLWLVPNVLSQGVVAFRNDNLSSPPDRLVRGADGTTPLTGTTFAAQLWYGNDPASMQAHPTLAYFRAPTTSSPGTWSGGGRTLPSGFGGVGTTIFLQVAVWDSGPNRTVTFEQARAGAGPWGCLPLFTYTQQLSDPPNPTEDTKMNNFQGGFPFSLCVPEPAVALLLLPGIAVCLLVPTKRRSSVGP